MYKFITPLLFLLFFSCAKENQSSNLSKRLAINNNIKAESELTITDNLYDLQFNIEKSENKNYLVISIQLKNDSFFVSPNAKQDFTGKFTLDLGSYKDINLNGKLIETPPSVEEYDPHPFVNGLVNWVHANTIYKQELNILNKDDFEVFGRVQFTIEPRCTLEQIPFSIVYKDGKLTLVEPKC
jgi:hypothetical protein